MARPRLGIDAYYDIRPIWFAAFRSTSISRTFQSEREAIQLVQRLNALRMLWRQKDDSNALLADKYQVRREHNKVVIEQRLEHPVELWIDNTTGRPIDKQQIQEDMFRLDMMDLEREGIVKPHVDPYDPDAPLGLTED